MTYQAFILGLEMMGIGLAGYVALLVIRYKLDH